MQKTLERPSTNGTFALRKTVAVHSNLSLSGYQVKTELPSNIKSKAVQSAVLTHIKALRELGKTRVNTREIAQALSLPVTVVEHAVSRLHSEGVKIAE